MDRKMIVMVFFPGKGLFNGWAADLFGKPGKVRLYLGLPCR
jgi:hypothetical protein